jgi:hypothetical protein
MLFVLRTVQNTDPHSVGEYRIKLLILVSRIFGFSSHSMLGDVNLVPGFTYGKHVLGKIGTRSCYLRMFLFLHQGHAYRFLTTTVKMQHSYS